MGLTVPQLRKSKRRLEQLIREHIDKLQNYKKDPLSYDNLSLLKNAKTEEHIQQIFTSRVKHLEKEINNFAHNIGKINKEFERRMISEKYYF